jgi:adenine-specific DNA-methyltransferase
VQEPTKPRRAGLWFDLSLAIVAAMNGAQQWATRLGLAASPLFPSGSTSLPGEHYAMLDGRRASFACSTTEALDVSPEISKNWRWSADLAHHVFVTEGQVSVWSGRDPQTRRFRRNSVENHLEEFLAFLDNSRGSALPDVVSFLVDEFRGIWAASGSPRGSDALAAFLLSICAAGQDDPSVLDDPTWRRKTALDIGIEDPPLDEGALNQATVERGLGMRSRAPLGLRLIPSLVLRHAAGRLFQEAHAVLESIQLGLFGNTSITTVPTYSPAGAFFTPVPIARLLAEWALAGWAILPDELTIADFACGSAVFLTEALRALEQRGFGGTVRLIGRDKSPQAITMAKVAVRTVQHEMREIKVIADISLADALAGAWPRVDVVLMNPPFRSWEQMSSSERDWVQEATHAVDRGRPDLSVGFIERGIQALNPSGVIATLIPAGVLASDGLSKWREGLVQRTTPTLVAVLGEHGLFQHALVNVGILALRNTPSVGSSELKIPLHIAWSSAESGAASRAIRAIRRSISKPPDEQLPRVDASGWSLTLVSLDFWKQRPSWLPGAGALGTLLETLQSNLGTRVRDLFRVRQGIRTGANQVFLQPKDVVAALPEQERRYFREAVVTSSFVDGEIKSQNYLFLPDDAWQTESEVRRAIPIFFTRYLRTYKEVLAKRKSLGDGRWWRLTRSRSWKFEGPPRLLSKRFGLYPAFARDFRVKFAPVQANAWIPTDALIRGRNKDAVCETLTAYWWLLNSRIAVALLREYCPNVAGGQLDLEHKYVEHVPLPNLFVQFRNNPALQMLASSIRTRNAERLPKLIELDQFAAAAFGTDVSDWNLSGLELPD